ncbi:MAG: hypothetical protein KGS72_05180 [Cyanobacteria bacterium REEB67]|nr:hypothetical protein [Cyanobacteria bacterium REEB67]
MTGPKPTPTGNKAPERRRPRRWPSFWAAMRPLMLALSVAGGLQPIANIPAGADTLRGNVEETGVAPTEPVFNPAVPMAVPVFKPKIKAGVEKNDALKGSADDDNTKLQEMKGQTDDSNPLSGSAQEDGAPLKATLSQDQLQSEDPDKDDQMLAVEWDKWHNRLLWSIQSGVQEIVNSPENMEPHFDPQRGKVVLSPNIPLGTKATFFCRVSSDKRILKASIVQSSGNAGYDKALLDAIYSLDGSSILRYPAGSRRRVVNEAASILTSDKGGREFFKFGDTERYKAP